MTRRARSISYGSAGASILAGALCAALFGGATGPILGIVLIGLGLIALVSLVFLEVGLSEDRERARSAPGISSRPAPRITSRSASARYPPAPPRASGRLKPLRPDRARGRRRRLR